MKKPVKKPPRKKLGDYSFNELFAEIRTYIRNVADGADPIEALHGHVCGRGCWHWAHLSDDEIAKREAKRAGKS